MTLETKVRDLCTCTIKLTIATETWCFRLRGLMKRHSEGFPLEEKESHSLFANLLCARMVWIGSEVYIDVLWVSSIEIASPGNSEVASVGATGKSWDEGWVYTDAQEVSDTPMLTSVRISRTLNCST